MKFTTLEDLKQLEGGYIKVGSAKIVMPNGWQCIVLHPAEPGIETVVTWVGHGEIKTSGGAIINGLRPIGILDTLIVHYQEQPRTDNGNAPTPS